MQVSELIRELSTLEDGHLPQALAAQIREMGAAAIPPLLALLEAYDEPTSGWGPVHAASLLGELGAERAIEPMLKALVDTDWDDALHDQIALSLPRIGQGVIEPALRAVLEYEDSDLTGTLATVLADVGVRDPRIFALLLDELRTNPEKGAGDLGAYGDPAALPYLLALLDEHELDGNASDPLANRELVEFRAAIEALGGELTAEQQRKCRHAGELAGKARTRAFGQPATRLQVPGRNEPCYCGSGKKYKKCCLREDEAARHSD